MSEQWKIEFKKNNEIINTEIITDIKLYADQIEFWCYDENSTVNISYAGLKQN
jgi:hypothetical protein